MKKLLLAMLMVGGAAQAYTGYSRISTQEQQREKQEKMKYIKQQRQKALNNLYSAAEQAALNWATPEEINKYVQSGIQNAQMQNMEE